MSLYVVNQEQVSNLVADAIKRADRKTVMRVLFELSGQRGLLKTDGGVELYACVYETDKDEYHFGRMDGLE